MISPQVHARLGPHSPSMPAHHDVGVCLPAETVAGVEHDGAMGAGFDQEAGQPVPYVGRSGGVGIDGKGSRGHPDDREC